MGQSRMQAQQGARPVLPQKDWLLRFRLLLARMPVNRSFRWLASGLREHTGRRKLHTPHEKPI